MRSLPTLLTSVLLFAGCEPLPPSDVVITKVEVVRGDPSGTDFLLRIEGRGFGFGTLSYSIGEGTGTGDTDALGVEIFNDLAFSMEVPRAQLSVVSPRRIEVHLQLETRFPPGTYSVRITDQGAELAIAPLVLEVP